MSERLVSRVGLQYEDIHRTVSGLVDATSATCLACGVEETHQYLPACRRFHAFGVRGQCGLGCAEEQDVIKEIDFLVGTFGKAAASVGAFVIYSDEMKRYLVNKMRTLILRPHCHLSISNGRCSSSIKSSICNRVGNIWRHPSVRQALVR